MWGGVRGAWRPGGCAGAPYPLLTLGGVLEVADLLLALLELLREVARLLEHHLVAAVGRGLEVLVASNVPFLLGLRVGGRGRSAAGAIGARGCRPGPAAAHAPIGAALAQLCTPTPHRLAPPRTCSVNRLQPAPILGAVSPGYSGSRGDGAWEGGQAGRQPKTVANGGAEAGGSYRERRWVGWLANVSCGFNTSASFEFALPPESHRFQFAGPEGGAGPPY